MTGQLRLFLGLVTLIWAMPAGAEVRPLDINRPVNADGLGPGYGGNTTQWAVELTGYFGTREEEGVGDVSRFNFGPVLRIATPERRNDFEVTWALISHRRTFDANEDSEQQLLLGNVHLGYYWAWRTLPRQVRAGLTLTIPAANLPTDAFNKTQVAIDGYDWLARSRGWRELWLWTPETLSVGGHLDYYLRTPSGFIVGGQLLAMWMQRISDSAVIDDSNVLLQADLDLIYEAEVARFTVRGGAVALPLTETDDKLLPLGDTDALVQASVEPEARFRVGPIDVVARVTVPLNEPAGFAFSEGGAWTVHLGVANPTVSLLPEAADPEVDAE